MRRSSALPLRLVFVKIQLKHILANFSVFCCKNNQTEQNPTPVKISFASLAKKRFFCIAQNIISS